MSADEHLFRLYQLHQVDEELYHLKSKIKNLDVGKDEAEQFNKLKSETKDVRQKANNLQEKAQTLETKIAEVKLKCEKFEKQLFDGSITNAKEITNLQEEVKMLTNLKEEKESELSDVKTSLNIANIPAEDALSKLKALKKKLLIKQSNAKSAHADLVAQYKAVGAERPAKLDRLEASLIKSYETVLKKTGNTALSLVNDGNRCEACGAPVPERTKEQVQSGKLLYCESCGRILFVLLEKA